MAEQSPAKEQGQALPRWLDELRPGGQGEGFIEKQLRHSLMFVRRPVNRLLVSFDNLSNVGDTSLEREPWAFKFAQDSNISHLGVMAHVSDWYRDPVLIERMQTLATDGFFDGYDRVVFAGVSMGGFASIVFGSLVPGAHAVAINPQSTLDEALVPWETRYENGRRQDWTLPLSDAAALTGGFERVNVFYDPYHELDQAHVDRFGGDNVHVFNCRYSNHKTAVFLRKIDALKPVMHAAIFGELTELEFYRLYRARRNLPWFRGALSSYYESKGRNERAEQVTALFRSRIRQIKREEAQEAEAAKEWGEEGDAAETAGSSVEITEVSVPAIRPQGSRRNARRTIVTTMKNEGPFMLEWVAYHRAIGFTDFLIYTNHCDDGTDRIAMRLEELGVVQHVYNQFKQGASPQRVALRRARREKIYDETDWIICSDCDEFLNVRADGGTLDDLFEAVGGADAISLCWKIFGCGDRVAYEDRFVTEQFTWGAQEDFRGKYKALGLKTLFRPSDAITKIGVHRPKFQGRPEGFVWTDAGGQPMPDKYFAAGWSAWPEFRHDHARLHHYAVRSVDSFLVKRDRGRTNHIERDQGVAYWADLNLNMEEDQSLLPTVARTREVYDELLSDPEVARLHGEACDWHRAKIAALKEHGEWADLHRLLQTINRPGEMPVDRDQLLQGLAAE
ncbi:glycosyltransferase family 2 protein [Roseovarius sp. PS-C2]|uniref:glycosyltransferase family 2 protein n=1 Tax=Roseovarius sp. PS-C2 TaxID=2820814 RepID=UPI001C0D70DB|nr:glycosyltransferase family 2 protein [Roseovarius sp. PS-C2]MBU3261480.1 glycosyltransferase family 2 protein [Roseovarius sp. PS-C2]